MALKFKEAELKSIALPKTSFAEGEVETIDMDAQLPRGSDDDFQKNTSPAGPAKTALTQEQKALRLQLVKFKQSFEEFAVTKHLSRVNIAEIKRGDVVAIKTIVGSIYLRVLDRIKGERAGAGEILCECHYDLSDQFCPAHTASIQLPICANNHTITAPDGSKRQASRALKIQTETVLPPHVSQLLHERFFVEIAIHSSPQAEKLRLLDLGRWIVRMAFKLKAVIDENNRREREKKQQKEDARQQKKEEQQRKKEEKRSKQI